MLKNSLNSLRKLFCILFVSMYNLRFSKIFRYDVKRQLIGNLPFGDFTEGKREGKLCLLKLKR